MTLFTLWMAVLAVADLLLILQFSVRLFEAVSKRAARHDWSRYNRLLLVLLSLAFFPLAAVRALFRAADRLLSDRPDASFSQETVPHRRRPIVRYKSSNRNASVRCAS